MESSRENRTVRTLRHGEEGKHLAMLNLAYGPWGDEREWRKKYIQPDFDVTENVLVVEEEGKWAGGGTAWLREAFLKDGKKVKVYTAGDLYVHPNHRGQGIYSTAMKSLNKMARERGAALGFAFPSVYRLPSIALQKYGFTNALYPRTRMCILNPQNFLNYVTSQLKEAYLPSEFDGMKIMLTVRFSLHDERRLLNKTFRVEKGSLTELTEAQKVDLRVTLNVDLLLKISSMFYLRRRSLLPQLISALIRRRLGFRFSSRFLKAFLKFVL